MKSAVIVAAFLAVSAGFAAAQAPQAPPPGPPRTPPLLMTTSAFEDGGVIPAKYSQVVAAPVSPEFKWSQVPPGTQSFVLVLHDAEPVINKSAKMDATHWVVWNIPATSTGLPEGLPPGQLADGTRQIGVRGNAYFAPGAPPGPHHHYTFDLYALDIVLTVAQGTPSMDKLLETRVAVLNAMEGHVLGKAVIVGRFHR